MIHHTKPEKFNPKFEVVSCFIEHEDEILLLLRQDHKNQPNTYGIPAGKVGEWEAKDVAVIREIFEETGLEIDGLSYFKELYVQYPTYDFVYHIYHKKLDQRPEVKINLEEHKNHTWKTPKEALNEKLIPDEDVCIKLFYGL